MSVHEIFLGFQWLDAVLAPDIPLQGFAPGGLWRGQADPGTPTPFLIMSYQAGLDANTMNGFRVLDDLLYQVKAVGPASQTALITQAAARIDALIGKPPQSGTVIGGFINDSHRETPLWIDEIVNGSTWSNCGGVYRLQIQQTS